MKVGRVMPSSEDSARMTFESKLDVRDRSEGGAGGDLANFGVFDDAAAEVFYGGLEHGAAQVVAVDVEAGKRFQETADAGGGWRRVWEEWRRAWRR